MSAKQRGVNDFRGSPKSLFGKLLNLVKWLFGRFVAIWIWLFKLELKLFKKYTPFLFKGTVKNLLGEEIYDILRGAFDSTKDYNRDSELSLEMNNIRKDMRERRAKIIELDGDESLSVSYRTARIEELEVFNARDEKRLKELEALKQS